MKAYEIKRIIMDSTFSNDDLLQIAEGINYARHKLTRQVARSLQAGDEVRFVSTKTGKAYRGVLESIKIKNAIVTTPGGRYRVPMSMLEAV